MYVCMYIYQIELFSIKYITYILKAIPGKTTRQMRKVGLRIANRMVVKEKRG